MDLLSSVSLVLAFCLLLSLLASLFACDAKETLTLNFSREEAFKKELFKRYLEAEETFQKGGISQSEWELIRKKFLNEYKKNLF